MPGLMLADAAATYDAGWRLAAVLRAGDMVILTGPLGAGKTTFTKGLAEGLGVRGPVTSPTFVIARVHPSLTGGPELLHVDAYRLENAGQVWDLDLDTDTAVTVVEWGRGKAEELTAAWLELAIERPSGAAPIPHIAAEGDGMPNEPRSISWYSHGKRWAGVDVGAVLAGANR